jgi:thiamine biosynthesis lipoprotein ApbE
MILSFDHKYSRFREDSLVYHYNQDQIVPDDADFLRMLAIGEEYRSLTDGYFSLRVGGYLEELGYGKQNKMIHQTLHRKRSPSFDKEAQRGKSSALRAPPLTRNKQG